MKEIIYLVLCLTGFVFGKPNTGLDDTQQKIVPGQSEGEANGGYLFEGDMLMTKQQIKAAEQGGDVEATSPSAAAFGVTRSSYNTWPNGVVPYVIGKSAKNSVLNFLGIKGPTEKAILKAIKEWEAKTCIRFKKRTTERDYVEFVDGGYGKCYSWVGKVGGRQEISLGFECFYFGIALHEIGHALGLYHEQSRPDRDDFVYINWDKIKSEEAKKNFKKYSRHSIDSLGSPYDYDSIMHYEWNAFARYPWQRTIGAKNGASIGQRSHLSKEDIYQVKRKYHCR